VLGRDASRATRLPEPLTGRELEVLALVATGMANSAIAHELHVGVNTVKTHLKSAYGKLGVHSREQAVYLARELALL
jgi:ATP/maltotriose-dependent transcriptional regulator MalT